MRDPFLSVRRVNQNWQLKGHTRGETRNQECDNRLGARLSYGVKSVNQLRPPKQKPSTGLSLLSIAAAVRAIAPRRN